MPVTQANNAYLPALDGFRAISVALVFFSHAGLRQIVPGGLGVLIFFVISGFLLTRQMITEVEESGTLNVKNFYLRRFFRLAPSLLLYIALFSALLASLGAIITPMQVASGLFFFANYYDIFIGYTPHNPFPILWSLAVEEHYYILFPFCILAFRRNLKKLMPWLCLTLAAVFIWRVYLSLHCAGSMPLGVCGLPDSDRIFHGTDTIFDCILYGALTALCLHYYPGAFHRWLINHRAFFLSTLLLLATLLFRNPLFRETLRFSFQSAAIAIIIINVLWGKGIAEMIKNFLSLPPLLLIGRMSYSLYLFHFGVLNCVSAMFGVPPSGFSAAAFALYFAGSVFYASASYFLVERPVMTIRKRLRRRVGA